MFRDLSSPADEDMVYFQIQISWLIREVRGTQKTYVKMSDMQTEEAATMPISRFSVVACTLKFQLLIYEGWNLNSGNYLFTTDTK